jgi:uncharacterized membrane protein
VREYRQVFGSGTGTSRIEAFSDGVFAIAITLLVLSLQVPNPPPGSPPLDVLRYLQDQAPNLRAYVVSFLVVGLFWMTHHRMFAHIERHDSTLMWLNLILLLFISFLPFPTAILGRYESPDAVRLYAGNLAAIGVAQTALWTYAAWGGRLVGQDVDSHLARYTVLRGVVATLVFVTSIGVSYVDATLAMLWWGWILIGFLALDRLYQRDLTGRQGR